MCKAAFWTRKFVIIGETLNVDTAAREFNGIGRVLPSRLPADEGNGASALYMFSSGLLLLYIRTGLQLLGFNTI